MKKFFLLLTATLWLFISCEGSSNKDVIETYWFVKEVPVRSGDWELVNGVNQLGSYYRYSYSLPELDRDIYNKGHVICYMFFRNEAGSEVQTSLPFTVARGERTGNTENLWTETYSYEFLPGRITFTFTYSDFFTDVPPPNTTFRIVLNY